MPGLLGPFLTTGAALSAAVVVVTNPVTAPKADVAIPAAAVSAGTGQAVDMLDENFIKAVAPEQPESTNPFIVLKDLVSTLVADAADLGKAAVEHAFSVGAGVVSRPELTAATFPYVPSDILPRPFPEDLRPVVEQAWADIAAHAGTTTDPDLLAAALAAEAALGTEPGALLQSLRDAVDGALERTIQPALDNAASALAAAPHSKFGDTVRAAVQRFPVVNNIAALPKRWDNPGVGLLASTPEPSNATTRPDRPMAVERALSAARSVERRLNSVTPRGTLSGLARVGAQGDTGSLRKPSDAFGPVKPSADRNRR